MKPRSLKMRKLLLAAALLFSMIGNGCYGEWSSAGDPGVYRCSLDTWWGTSPVRAANAGEYLYILDNSANVYRYTFDPSRECAYEWDRNFASLGTASLSGFADDIAFAGTSLYWNTGNTIELYGDDLWNCSINSGEMALTASAALVGGRNGVREYRFNASGCTPSGAAFSGAAFVLAIDTDGSRVFTAEALALSETAPERLVIYDRAGGNALIRTALSPLAESEMHFCSATRIRRSNAGILLLDSECETLGVFDDNGIFQKRIDLKAHGIRSAKDLYVSGNDAYILTASSLYLSYRLSLGTLLGNSSYNEL
ncbi:MAG: hypothetical protein LBR60_04800 [Fibrobacter sp.]|nr:hypothetical protein [Fibrobacter sp.]